MPQKKVPDVGQLSLFDMLPKELAKQMESMSSDEWMTLIQTAQKKMYVKRAEEEAERKRIEAEEEQRKREEEQRKHNEHVAAVTCMDLPLGIDNEFAGDERAAVHADSIADGLTLSLTTLGRVDIEYIAQVSGYSFKEVIQTLKGSIYQNPTRWDECYYKGWETADEYLSGNLMRKYKTAEKANKTYNGWFADNLNAIEAVLPAPVRADGIYVTLGSPWVPPDVIDEFIIHMLDIHSLRSNAETQYEPLTGTWTVPCKSDYRYHTRNHRIYGTESMSALDILEKTLNMKTLQVFNIVPSPTTASGVKKVANKEETTAVNEKQREMVALFQNWIWQNDARKKRLEIIYENNFSCVRQRQFRGDYLQLTGLSPAVTLYPYQKNAVARILFTPNTLLAHDVGAGKTYIMVAAGMELRRMGISRKNVYVVPNNIVGQWRSIFLSMYPHAKLLTVEPRQFTPKKRQAMLKTIRDGDYDAVIMAYSCFEFVPLSKAYYERQVEEEIHEVDVALTTARNNIRLHKRKESLQNTLNKLRADIRHDGVPYPEICCDDLGINTLFVDEAHNFKNITINTKIDKVLGITKHGSRKCNEMLDKVRCIQRNNNGRGIVFATGTPITNSVTDIFVMQTYLQSGELRFLELHHFDNWAATFGEKMTEFEVDVDTSTYRLATRFSKFHNLPELTNLLAQIADFHAVDKQNGLPNFNGYSNKRIAKTSALTTYLSDISARADQIRQGLVNRADDNMLKLTTDGRKAALDMRLAVPASAFTYDCKVYRCAENVLNIYNTTAAQRLTQLVFCDTSTPKAGFNIYDELKNLLVYHGAVGDEIAFVHDYDTPKLRAKLFTKMQNGDIRVLVGSTFKLGMGVNIQRKLIAIHHLDVPWRPADMIQREGRILRQGNENKNVEIFRYITDGSFDAYSWQLLESKQRFICQILSGMVTERSASDVDDVVLNYAEIKALAIGNPLIKSRVETSNEIKRLCILQRKLFETRNAMCEDLLAIPGQIEHCRGLIEKAEQDWQHYQANRKTIKEMKAHRQIGAVIVNALRQHIMQKERKTLLTYQGFDIVLPDNMQEPQPYVWIAGNGFYYVETGDSDIGCITRIDNKLNSLPDFIDDQNAKLRELTTRKTEFEAELCTETSYAPQIEELTSKVHAIDRELGVNAP